MSSIIWKSEYSTGNESIDSQHKELISIMNNLIENIKIKGLKNVTDKTIMELSNYTFYHFSAEEDLMEKIKYPELEEHKGRHKDLIDKLSKITNRIYEANADPAVDFDLQLLLKDWLITHILDEDLKIKLFIDSEED